MLKSDEIALLKALEWYQDVGVTQPLQEKSLDWMQAEFSKSQFSLDAPAVYFDASASVLDRHEKIVGLETGLHTAKSATELAASAHTLAELKSVVEAFEGCALKATAHKTCFADGSTNADVMIIGEAPGRDEDRAGVPFVGQAGQLLNVMLSAIGMDRNQDFYITNTVYWRPLGNRAPSTQETELCKPFLHRQIELVKPKIILVLGNSATKTLLQSTQGIMRVRGKWHQIEVAGETYNVLPSLHPAYLLRTPLAKRLIYRDFLSMQVKLGTV